MNKTLSASQRKALGRLMKSAKGRQVLASSIREPLRSTRDYYSVIRKFFKVDYLAQGSLPIYEKDVEVAASVLNSRGEAMLSHIDTEKVQVQLMEITSTPVVSLLELKQKLFDCFQRMQQRGVSEINKKEDTYGISIIRQITNFASYAKTTLGYDEEHPFINIPIEVTGSSGYVLTRDALADAFELIERHNLRVARILLSPQDFKDIRKWGRDEIDFVTQKKILDSGFMGSIWGAQIIVTPMQTRGKVDVFATASFVGRVAVQTELQVVAIEDPKNREVGFSLFEHEGFMAHNPRAISQVIITRA